MSQPGKAMSAVHVGPGPMQAIPSELQPYALTWIVYVKVKYNGPGAYSYDINHSGYYNVPVPGGIDAFVSQIVQSSPQIPTGRVYALSFYGPDDLDFTLDQDGNCYIVFHLDEATDPQVAWQYRYSADGIETNATAPHEYLNLVHEDDNQFHRYGKSIISAPTRPPSTPQRFAYFMAKVPSTNGMNGIADGFNLWVNYFGTDNKIDPEIKNTGHTSHVTGAPATHR